MFKCFKKEFSQDQRVALWLTVWCVVNILQAAFTELSNDEAYYHLYARNLAWGYFDHPPIVALLVWLGEKIFSTTELGVRFFFTLLQPLYLYLFWKTIKPQQAQKEDAWLYLGIVSSLLIIQLYGFIAVPDGPLMASVALFLYTWKIFTEEKRHSAIALGFSVGLMALSKYHGAFVLLFTLMASIPFFVQRPKNILRLVPAAVIALLVIFPHLKWQNDNGWVSILYHASGRNGEFKMEYLIEFIINVLVVFSPLYLPLWVKSYRYVKAISPLERALKFMPIAFIIFFTASSCRGYVQPQWVIAASFGLIWILFSYLREHQRSRRYLYKASLLTLLLLVVVRIEMIFNPLGIYAEIFNNRTLMKDIQSKANGRPVIFDSRYTMAAKYLLYTGEKCYSQADIELRASQWNISENDREFIGKPVMLQVYPTRTAVDKPLICAKAPSGSDMFFIYENCYRPVHEIKIDAHFDSFSKTLKKGDKLNFTLDIYNPYPYDVLIDGHKTKLELVIGKIKHPFNTFSLTDSLVLKSNEHFLGNYNFTMPEMKEGKYDMGFVINRQDLRAWYGGRKYKVRYKD